MTRMKAAVRSWNEAREFLLGENWRPFQGKLPPTERKLGYATWVVSRISEGEYGIRHHNTIIVRYLPDNDVVLDTGGWLSLTTKERLNQFIPLRYSIYQRNFEWFVLDSMAGRTFEYFDGCVLNQNDPVVTT